MEHILKQRAGQTDKLSWKPIIYSLDKKDDLSSFSELIRKDPQLQVADTYSTQLKDLIKSRNATIRWTPENLEQEFNKIVSPENMWVQGSWIYYPWQNRVVHTLKKEDFIELRTNRNKYKITADEQAILSTKTIAIVGLSVGQSVALTCASERIAGRFILIDFDTLDLSNLNRIRTGIHNLEVPKVIIAAREIAEIDPYLDILIWEDGLHENNLPLLCTGDLKADLIFDECDSMEMKIMIRQKAKEYMIPVVMDTSDRGQLDIERFDLEPGRPIIHGRLEHLDLNEMDFKNPADRIKILLSILDFEAASSEAKYSFSEIGKSISTWPQLASSVVLGGALCADIGRRIFLDKHKESGRYFVDLNQLI